MVKKTLLISGRINQTKTDVYIEVSTPEGTSKADFSEILRMLEKAVEECVDGQESRT